MAGADRTTHRNGYRPRRWDTRAGEVELQIPKIRQGSYFPSFLAPRRRSEQALLRVVQQAYVCGVSTRRVDQLVESLGSRISKSEVSRICQALDEHVDAFRTRPLESRYPYLSWTPRSRRSVTAGAWSTRRCTASTRPAGARSSRSTSARPRPRRLDQLPQRPGPARPGRRPARHQRRARRPEGGDRQGPGLRLAALHRPLPQRLLRSRPQGPAWPARRPDPASPACSASSRTMSGWSAAATCRPSRSLSPSRDQTITHPRTSSRRWRSVKRPEPPTSSSTSEAPTPTPRPRT
jgi:mutator family transposase